MTNDNRISRWLLGTKFVRITLCLGLSSCFESATFTDIGNGYQFGYYNGSKLTSNVFYNDQGIIPGVCSYAEWNDNFILVKAYPSNNSNHLMTTNTYLINRDKYKKDPRQDESNGVIGPLSEDSLNVLLKAKNIVFSSKRSIDISQ